MTREDYETKNFDELMLELPFDGDSDVTSRECLLNYAIHRIEDDDLYIAIHILEAVYEEYAYWYLYDYCMGTLQTPSAVKTKEDIEHLISDE